MSILSKPFHRDVKNKLKYQRYVDSVSKKFNYQTVLKKTFNPKKFINIYEFDFYIAYSFQVIKDWINKNEIYTDKYIETLEYLINKLHLINHLNSLEQEYIIHFRSVTFAKKRNLKKLIVDFPLEKSVSIEKRFFIFEKTNILNEENAFFNFDNSSFFELIGNKKTIIVNNSNIYLTDRRIVILDKINFYSIYYKDIQSYKMGNKYFELEYKNKKLLINTSDNYEFFVSYERANKMYN